MSIQFQIASTKITSEIIDGEVMIMNLENGKYYSLEGTATDIWQLIQKGLSREAILETLQSIYPEEADALQEPTLVFLDKLQSEGVIKKNEAPLPEDNSKNLLEDFSQKGPFQDPILNKYTDMQDLLLLDPIHDVDQGGWPRGKENL